MTRKPLMLCSYLRQVKTKAQELKAAQPFLTSVPGETTKHMFLDSISNHMREIKIIRKSQLGVCNKEIILY